MTNQIRAASPGQSMAFPGLLRNSDLILAVAVLMIVAMMIVPLPSLVLDILITINLSGALLILLLSLYSLEPLQFSVFPTLLLMATLFRLGLNISATRLILLNGEAGQVIHAFGNFVVGGSYVVGVVVFLILIVIQFVVITNGAGRVAEVAARFTLDAMPGKQMAIDADLNAGLITEDVARERRRAIEREADFYGSMDGASKFVKGDAVAGVIIILINIVGGLAIGLLQKGIPLVQALQTYTLLTIGDGLVSQIPALIISTATGVIVTRASSDFHLGHDVVSQVLGNRRALAIVAGLLFALGLIPGLPKLPFFVMGSLLGGISYFLRSSQTTAGATPAALPEASPLEPENLTKAMQVDPMELEIGYGLIPLVEGERGGNLLGRIAIIRRQIALDLGIIVPTIRIRDSMELPPNSYVVKLRGVRVAEAEIRPDKLLAMNPGLADEVIPGIPTREPAFNVPALWIDPEERERAEIMGYTVVDPFSVVATHLTEVIKSNAAAILGRQDVQSLIDGVKAEYPAVLDGVVPDIVNLGDVHKVLRNLLREGISIRDLVTVLETIANSAGQTTDPDQLSEHVRQALARSICVSYLASDGALHVVTLSPDLQHRLAGSMQRIERGMVLSLDPETSYSLAQDLAAQAEAMASKGYQPVLLCAFELRQPLRRLIERTVPSMAVLSYGEIPAQITVRPEGMVEIHD
ncbi:MAG: flagellar biosynthesis protein FlhA [Chloroflexota bacterium]|nr:MAG: flagellar biosynthesis protein FlhA [Chloroflexota bacterium]